MPQATDSSPFRVYCAGPLFNQAERDEMSAIAETLCAAGYSVYLPHRDGMEFRLILDVLVDRGWPNETAGEFLHSAIFALDVYQLAVECDGMVWNLNGRTPDEGAVAEAAMAWTLGKPLVAYCDDARSLIAGRANPLLAGMVEFATVDRMATLPDRLSAACKTPRAALPHDQFSLKMRRAVRDGRKLWKALCEQKDDYNDEAIANVVAELFAPTAQAPF